VQDRVIGNEKGPRSCGPFSYCGFDDAAPRMRLNVGTGSVELSRRSTLDGLCPSRNVTSDRDALALLCRLFAAGQISAIELAYTADVLQFSDRVDFSGEDVASDLAECTDPEKNGRLTVARALEIAGTTAA